MNHDHIFNLLSIHLYIIRFFNQWNLFLYHSFTFLFELVFAGPVLEQNRDLTISQIGLCIFLCMYVVWQYDDWSTRISLVIFLVLSLVRICLGTPNLYCGCGDVAGYFFLKMCLEKCNDYCYWRYPLQLYSANIFSSLKVIL